MPWTFNTVIKNRKLKQKIKTRFQTSLQKKYDLSFSDCACHFRKYSYLLSCHIELISELSVVVLFKLMQLTFHNDLIEIRSCAFPFVVTLTVGRAGALCYTRSIAAFPYIFLVSLYFSSVNYAPN